MALVIDLENNVWGFGSNDDGQLGLGTDEENLVPVRLPITKAKSVTAGWYHSIIIDFEDNIWVTGSNTSGELGLGDNAEGRTFTLLPHLKGIQANAAYFYSIIIGTRIQE